VTTVIHTMDFIYSIDPDTDTFCAIHADGRVYELALSDMTERANNEDVEDDAGNYVSLMDAYCQVFYRDWEDNLFEPKSSPTR